MYAKSMTTGEIEAHIQDIYCISVLDSTVSDNLAIPQEWKQRPMLVHLCCAIPR